MATRVYDGFTALPGGVNGGMAASLIGIDQCAASKDFTFRDGFPKTRPPFTNLPLTFANDTTQARWVGKFQDACFYESEFGSNAHIVSRGGRLFKIDLGTHLVSEITPQLNIVTTAAFVVPAPAAQVTVDVNDEAPIATGDTLTIDSGSYTVLNRFTRQLLLSYIGGAANATALAGNPVLDGSGDQIVRYETNPADYDFVFMFQAENYVIVLAGQNSPVIYDGSNARLAGNGEIPPGVLGIYVWGRIWITLPDRTTFIAGDIVFGPSGTAQNGYRDAILKVTENDFLNEGGTFGVPKNAGPITSMTALATQDTSLGVGALLIGTTNMVFSVNTPIDRTTWKNLTYPIQTISLIDYGPQGPRHTISVNGDMWYRSTDGIRSFIVARRNMDMWGNTPMSREISPVLDLDTSNLLFYGSAILFDNKLFTTVSPNRTTVGVAHRGAAVINFDLLSNMRSKTPPAWEGVYTGLNLLKLTKGQVNAVERGFAFVANDEAVELWEINKTGFYDQFTNRTSIQPWLETRSYPFGDGSQLKEIITGELFLDQLVDTVTIVVKFRPDQYPVWTTWATMTLCANVTQCTLTPASPFNCLIFKPHGEQYAARIMLPRPPEDDNIVSGKPISQGYEFQFRLEITGHARVRKFKPHAVLKSDDMTGAFPDAPVCKTVEDCGVSYFDYDSHGA